MQKLNKLTRVAMCTAVMVVLSQIVIPLPFTPIPFSCAVLAVFLISALLDPASAVLCQLVYVGMGLIGLPVFSGFTGGLAKVMGPTGGFIWAYIVMAFMISFTLKKLGKASLLTIALVMGASLIPCYLMGMAWLSASTGISLWKAFLGAVAPFVIFDIAKLAIAAMVAVALRKNSKVLGLS